MRFWYLLVYVLIFFSCAHHETENTSRTVFRYNESKGISTLDPAFARTQVLTWPICQLYNGLLEMDDSLKIQPSIAKRWEVSKDGLTYTFYLRNDVYFHDHPVFPSGKGRKVVANDFVYSFSRILDPKVASPGIWVFNTVAHSNAVPGFIAENDTIFKIRLKKRFAIFPGLLTMPYCCVVPKEIVDYYGADFRSHPVGTGPFMFKIWREGEKLIFVKNPNYFEKDSTGQRLPYLDAIAITFIGDKQSEFLEFIKGNIDFLSGVHTASRNELLTRSGKLNPKYAGRFNMDVVPYLNTEYLGCMIDSSKLSGNPLLIKNVRKAINFGFDRAKMLKYLRNNLGTPAYWGIIPKGMPGFSEDGEAYTFNPDLSRKLLTQAGFPDGKALPEITLLTTSDYIDLCEYIQHELLQVGIRLKIEVSNGATFRDMVANSKASFFRSSWIADYPDAENYLSLFYGQNLSPNGSNYTHFKNPAFDRLYETAIPENDAAKRVQLYKKMNQIIVSEAVIIPLFYDMAVRFYPKNIKGFKGNPLNLLRLKKVKNKSTY
jgi:peptide/nickel transport system substrate-binding protein